MAAPPQTDRPIAARSRALRIVIAEDEAINATLLTEVLEDLGHSICAIESTEAGTVNAALRYKPDLMIVDATLTVGTGVGAVSEILRTGPVPHLFITGDIGRLAGTQLHTVFLCKPFRIADLEQAIERALMIDIAQT